MRRSIAKKAPDICFFCALRLEAASYLSHYQSPRQVRAYRSSAPSWRPAGVAAAQREEEDDDSNNNSSSHVSPRAHPAAQKPIQQPELFWKCRCGHFNLPRRDECAVCSLMKRSGAQLVQKPPPGIQTPLWSHPPPQRPQPSVMSSAVSARNAPSLSPTSRLNAFSGSREAPTASIAQQRQAQHSQESRGPTAASYGTRYPAVRSKFSEAALDIVRDSGRLGPTQQVPAQNTDRGTRLGNFIKDLAENPNPTRPLSRPSYRPVSRGSDALDQLAAVSGRHTQSPPQDFRIRRRDSPTSSTGSKEPPETSMGWQRSPAPDDRFSGLLPRSRREPPSKSSDKTTWDLPPRVSGKSGSQLLGEIDTVDQAADDLAESTESSRRKKGTKNANRRRERFELDDTIASSLERGMSNRRSKGTFGGRKDPSATAFELELADVERRLLEGNDKDSDRRKKQRQAKKQAQRARPRLEIPEFISVENLAKTLKIRLDRFIDQLEDEGFEGARYDHVLDSQTSTMFVELHGFEPVVLEGDTRQDIIARPPPEDPSSLPQRPPIVTIMGHVDHGKTTILDWLRKSSVVASEHGGITQHIGAFSVTMPGSQRSITFLDTPGHAAFLDMRRRGANVTDIVVLVVAADDSVKPQTLEAIKHAKDAGVHMIVAINKVDKEDADVERVKQDLAREDVTVEDYGGDYQAIPLSGKTGQGMANLEEAIITLADVSDFRAEAEGPVEGAIIESKVTMAGRVATILVRRGTLKIGDFIVAGNTWARVRTLRNDAGQLVEEAPPGTPVQVDGWRGEDPSAGLEVLQADDEQHAKDVVDLRTEKTETMKIATEMAALNATKSEAAEARTKVKEWEKEQGWGMGKIRAGRPWDNEGWVEPTESSGPKRVHFVIKADVAGSAEAIVGAVSAIGNNEVVANVVHSGTGHLSESDIRLLAATGEVSYAINFNQPIEGTIHRLAEAANVQIMDHNIIYKVTDQVKEKVSDELPPLVTYKVHGEAEVGQIFEITTKKSKVKVAGCKVTNGTVSRSQKVKVLRDNEVIYTGTLDSLKNVKKDVSEMRKGSECGMAFDGWDDFQEGDKVQCFEELKEKRKLY